jgi:hypothetical protein
MVEYLDLDLLFFPWARLDANEKSTESAGALVCERSSYAFSRSSSCIQHGAEEGEFGEGDDSEGTGLDESTHIRPLRSSCRRLWDADRRAWRRGAGRFILPRR